MWVVSSVRQTVRLSALLCLVVGSMLHAGVPNVPQTAGTLIAGPFAPQQGRTAVLVYHQGWLFTFPEVPSSSPITINGVPTPLDYEMRQWNVDDLSNITEVAQLGYTVHGFDAHAAMRTGNWVLFGTYQFHVDSPGGPLIEEPYTDYYTAPYARGNLQPPYDVTSYWSYDEVSGDVEYRKNGNVLARWDHLGQTGVISHAVVMGNLLFMLSEQTNTGIAIYDMSPYLDGDPNNDPDQPALIGAQTTGGFGGYWSDLFGMDGRLYAVSSYRTSGDGLRIIDVTDPSNPGNMTDIRFSEFNSSSMYPQFQDHYVFTGSSKIDMRSQEVVLTLPTETAVHTVPGMGDGDGIDTSQYLLPVGNLLFTGGMGGDQRIQGMAVWAHQSDPDTTAPVVGYHIPRAGQTNYPIAAPISVLVHETLDTTTLVNGSTFIVRPLGGGAAVSGSLFLGHTGMITFQPDAPLTVDTTYEVILNGIEDAVGNAMSSYEFTFSTGGSVGGNQPPNINSFTASPSPALPGQNISFAAGATDPDDDPLSYRLIYGDGRTSDWTTSTSFNVSYPDEGHYRAMLQVRDPSGVTRTQLTTVTVATPPTGPFPTNSSQIALDSANRRIYTVNPDNDTVSVVDADTRLKLNEFAAPGDPRSIAIDGSGQLWVTAFAADRIYVMNAANGNLVDTIQLDYGDAPFGVVFPPNKSVAYVSLYGSGKLVRFNPTTRANTGSVTLGPTPRALAVTGDGNRIFVTRFISGYGSGSVWEVRASDFSFQDTINLHTRIEADSTANGSGVPNYLSSVVIDPDGEVAWVATVKANITKGMVFDGTLNDPDNTVRAELIPFDLTTNETLTDARRIDLDNSDSPSAIGFSPLGDYLLVALQGNNAVMILDVFRMAGTQGLGSLAARVSTEAAPQGLVMDDNQVFVKNFLGRSVTQFSITDLVATGDASIPETHIDVVDGEVLSPAVFSGKKVFYDASDARMSSEGYISCATCHIDGGHDGRTWDFNQRGEGLRNTIPLWGRAGTGHGNVHWTANFNEIQDFENDIRGHFGGTGFLSTGDFGGTSDPLGYHKEGLAQELDDLAAYVTSLDGSSLPRSPHRTANGDATANALAGWDLFFQLECATCHNPVQQYTDRQLHDVGTIRAGTSGGRRGGPAVGIETPTLLGLFESGPYLHDGLAPELEDVFHQAGGTWYDNEDADTVGFSPTLWPTQTWLGGTKTPLDQSGRSMTWTQVNGGSGGTGQLLFRYANLYTTEDMMTLIVNGVSRQVSFPQTNQLTTLDRRVVLVEDVTLTAGTTNTIELRNPGGPRVQLDSMLVTTSNDLAKAEPHRRALDLNQSEMDQLLEFLLHLDGNSIVDSEAVERRWWTHITGDTVDDLRNDADFPLNPSGADILYSLQGLGWVNSNNTGPNNVANNFGQQIRGFITPTESGDHTFYISGDAAAEFWISTDDDPDNATLAASVPTATAPLTWNTHGSQTSSAISMSAGQRYYFEILHKDQTAEDHLAVAWHTPSGSSPTNGSDALVVPGTVLSPYTDSFVESLPLAPSNLEVRAFSVTKISVSFVDGADNELGHTLSYRAQGDPWIDLELASVSGSNTTVYTTLNYLEPGTTYDIRLRSHNRVGETVWTDTLSATTYALPTARILTFDGATPFRFTQELNLLQHAAVENDQLVMWRTDPTERQRGAVWLKEPISIADFDTTFVWQSTDVGNGNSTRLSFVIQNLSASEPSSGETGGYAGIFEPKAGLYISMGGNNAFMQALVNDTAQSLWNLGAQGYPFNNGDRYRVRLVYQGGNTDSLQLYLDNETTGDSREHTWTIDLDGTVPGPAYVGLITDNVFADQHMAISEWTLSGTAAANEAQCNFSLSPQSDSFTSSGGSDTFDVTARDGCDWSAVSDSSWLTVTSGSTGTGDGTVGYTAAANPTGVTRTGIIVAAGQNFTVTQTGVPCVVSLSPTSRNASANGGSQTLTVTIPEGCAWSATADVSWLTITSGNTGTGSGSVVYTVGSNPSSSSRSGTITVAGETSTINQAGQSCTFSLSPTSATIASSGGSSEVDVDTFIGCAWVATSNDAWITITSGSSGTGDGTVGYTVANNDTAFARNGSLTIAGETFNVTQLAVDCTYNLSPASRNVGAGATTGTVSVTAPVGCDWTASSSASWLTLTAGTSGSGDGTVSYSVAANTDGGPRSATVTIADQVFSLNQDGASCNADVTPTSANHPASGASSSLAVDLPNGCDWTASSDRYWIELTGSTSGNGAGTVSYTILPNHSNGARAGSITVAGIEIPITQDFCVVSLADTGVLLPENGGTRSFSYTSTANCEWPVSTDASWINLQSTTGEGNGLITFSVGSNQTGFPRIATIQAANQTYTVRQSACSSADFFETLSDWPTSEDVTSLIEGLSCSSLGGDNDSE